MNNDIPAEWEPFIKCGNNLMRTDDVIYRNIHPKYLGDEKFGIWELALCYTSHMLLIESGKCSLCDDDATHRVFRPSGTGELICSDCLTSIINTKKFKAGCVKFVYDDEYALDHRWNCYKRVLLKDVSVRLRLVLNNKMNCALCGFTPSEYDICRRCYSTVTRFMVKRAIMLRAQLIDDILVMIVRSIAG